MSSSLKILSVIVLVISLSTNLRAQDSTTTTEITKLKTHKLTLDLQVDASSNSITNSFAKPFLFGGFIDSEMKSQVINALKGKNLVGFFYDWGVEFRANSKKYPRNNFFVSYEMFNLQQITFDSSLFKLVFQGNSQFAGSSIELQNTGYLHESFQSIKFGFGRKSSGGKNSFDISLGIILANKIDDINFENSSFYTSSIGDSLILRGNATRLVSGQNNCLGVNGVGASVSARYSLKIDDKKEVDFSISNLGLVRWSSKTSYFYQPSDFVYSGFEVENIFEMSDSILKVDFNDSLQSYLNSNSTTKTVVRRSTAIVKLKYTHSFIKDKLYVFLGFDDFIFTDYKLKTILGLKYFINKSVDIQPFLSVGGYSNMSFGVAFGLKLKSQLEIKGNINYIDGLVFPGLKSGIGCNINLAYQF